MEATLFGFFFSSYSGNTTYFIAIPELFFKIEQKNRNSISFLSQQVFLVSVGARHHSRL